MTTPALKMPYAIIRVVVSFKKTISSKAAARSVMNTDDAFLRVYLSLVSFILSFIIFSTNAPSRYAKRTIVKA